MATAGQRLTAARIAAQSIGSSAAAGADPVAVVQRLGCMQGQDWGAVRRAIALRAVGLPLESSCDTEIFNSGAVVRSWPMRSTLHAVAAADLGWMLSLTAARQQQAAVRRRLDLGLTDDVVARARKVAERTLERPQRRADLLAAWQQAGIDTDTGRGYHLICHLAQSGVLVFGPVAADGAHLLVRSDSWISNPRDLRGDEALAEWLRRYFTSHGPATVDDFAWWTKLPKTPIKRLIGDLELPVHQIDGVTYYGGDLDAADAPPVIFTPAFDELLLGYGDRSATLPAEHAARVVPGANGVFKPVIVHKAAAVGTWKLQRGEILTEPFTAFAPRQASGIARAAAALAG